MKDKSLYFIAIIPEQPLREQVEAIKRDFSKSYHTRHALKSPPHITLIPPFSWEYNNEQIITRALVEFANAFPAFEVSISDFGSFVPRVIYLSIEKNDMLINLQNALSEKFNNVFGIHVKMSLPFHPHMTLAFRDLSPQMFYKAWGKYKLESFQESFQAMSLFMLKHNGKSWDIVHEMPFSILNSPS